MWGEIQTDSAANNAMKEGDDAFNNYRKLQGQDAIDAEQSAKEHINQLVEQRRAQLTSPWQKDLFDKQVRQYQYRYWNGGIANHANEQRNVFTSKTNGDTEQQGYNHIAQNFNNDAEFKVGLQQSMSAAMKQLQFNGQFANADARNQAVQIVTAKAYSARAEAMYAHNAPGGYAFVQAHEKEMGLYAAPLLDKFKARADSEGAALKSDVMRRITDAPNDTVRLGIVHANQGVLGNDYTGLVTQFGGAAPGQAPAATGIAPPSNVVPMPQARAAPVDPGAIRPGENPPDYAKRLLLQNEQKPAPTKPAGPDELGRVGGPNARIDVPPNPSMLTAGGRAELIANALKQYQPGTRLSVAGHEFVVPPAGTKFSYEGNSYTVPGGKPQQPAAAEPTPLPQPRPAATAPQPAPQQQGQNFTPIPAGGQAAMNAAGQIATAVPPGAPMKFGEAQADKTPNYSPAQKAIATAIDGHTDKNLGIQKLPGGDSGAGRDAALHSGPLGVEQFMANQGYPRSGNWCGEFAAAVVKSASGKPPKNPQIASNWKGWGQPTAEPEPGDVAVKRGKAPRSTR